MIKQVDLKSFRYSSDILIQDKDFIYVLPHSGLRSWISNYTLTFPGKETISDAYTIIPHGSATLVFTSDNRGIKGNLFGPSTKPCYVGRQANKAGQIFIIEFQPAGLYAFTGVCQKELADTCIPFEWLQPALYKVFAELLDRAEGVEMLVEETNRLLLSAFCNAYPPELKAAMAMIVASAGNLSARALSNQIYYSERHMSRIFNEYLGTNTKAFSRLVRINKAIRLMDAGYKSLHEIYRLGGFYDESHFIRDFKAICHISPQEYQHNMSDFYSEIAKF